MGCPEPDDLRDLGIMLKNAGMTAPQCAMGLRIAHIMQSLGIDEENFRTFISEIYQHCTEIGLRVGERETIARAIRDHPTLANSAVHI